MKVPILETQANGKCLLTNTENHRIKESIRTETLGRKY